MTYNDTRARELLSDATDGMDFGEWSEEVAGELRLALDELSRVKPDGWILVTGHGNSVHLGESPPECGIKRAWKPFKFISENSSNDH